MRRPFVSIIVPIRNEERYVERCLYSLAAQDYPRELFEIVVVDGESDDLTPQIVHRFAAESTVDLRLFTNARRTTATGLNIGVREARGEVIVRVDGHAWLERDYLTRAVDALISTGADCVGGVIESVGEGYVGGAIAAAMSSRFGVGGAAFRVGGEGPVDTVAFGAYRAEVFDRIGLFAEEIDRGEDDEFNYRLLDHGGVILLIPGLRAHYTVREGLAALWRQYYAYGRAKPHVLNRHPAQARLRQLVPAAFVATLGVSATAAAGGNPRPLRSLLRTYAAVASVASVATARRAGWRYLPPLPLAFACLHVSYGAGFLTGLLQLAGASLISSERFRPRRTQAPT